MEIADVAQAIAWQARHAEEAGAPITGRIIRAEASIIAAGTQTGARMANWPGLSLEDAMPLRVAGGLHFLHLTGATHALAPVYAGEVTDQAAVDALVAGVARDFDAVLLPWLDGPPQTNEAGRSASVMAGLLWLAQSVCPRFELIEIGASAGINTMMARYGYDLGGVKVGAVDSPMQIVPEWRGNPPPSGPVDIISVKGCDIAPVDLTDPAQAQRLKAYIWADATERMARMDVAIALAHAQRPDLVQMDAAAFVAQQLAAPQAEGVTRVLFHTVMWQYLPDSTRAAIRTMMEEAGARATVERPLAWLRVETNRTTFRHELTVKYWPGEREVALLAEAHPHGAWVRWLG
ncbi:DUF2332 domain-containing protein [Altererythrobacter lauratis]|uniref:DUF2332 domain-containing protein n=1 Tax=Alteraurantiacibacter lauratis TaxID=2054627 RepID=A0ABV7EGK0_9SPHN